MCENDEKHENVVGRGQDHARFPPGYGKSVILEFREDGCITWKDFPTYD